jgi:hypothetical protein
MRKHWIRSTLSLGVLLAALGAVRGQDIVGPDEAIPAGDPAIEASEPMLTVLPRGLWHDPDVGPIAKAWQIELSAGIYLLQPTFQSDPAVIVSNAGAPLTAQRDFNRHMIASPAVWLTIINERGWGLRTRYYDVSQRSTLNVASGPDESLSPASPVAGVQAPVFGTASAIGALNIDSWDLEVVCAFERARWCLLLGGGIRYAHVNQDYIATIADLGGVQTLATAHHNLNGVGPTFSLQGRRPLWHGCCLSCYGDLHASILFGSAEDNYTGTPPGGAGGAFSRHQISVLPIGELEVGLEASHPVHHCRLFFQTGFVGQVWWGGGSAANFDAVNNAAASNSNFGFIGLAIRGGIAF